VRVFVLHHCARGYTDAEDVKLVGVYSSHSAAEAVAKLFVQPGVRDNPTGFHIDEYELDRDHWIERFG
jgi:hypothetical protein